MTSPAQALPGVEDIRVPETYLAIRVPLAGALADIQEQLASQWGLTRRGHGPSEGGPRSLHVTLALMSGCTPREAEAILSSPGVRAAAARLGDGLSVAGVGGAMRCDATPVGDRVFTSAAPDTVLDAKKRVIALGSMTPPSSAALTQKAVVWLALERTEGLEQLVVAAGEAAATLGLKIRVRVGDDFQPHITLGSANPEHAAGKWDSHGHAKAATIATPGSDPGVPRDIPCSDLVIQSDTQLVALARMGAAPAVERPADEHHGTPRLA